MAADHVIQVVANCYMVRPRGATFVPVRAGRMLIPRGPAGEHCKPCIPTGADKQAPSSVDPCIQVLPLLRLHRCTVRQVRNPGVEVTGYQHVGARPATKRAAVLQQPHVPVLKRYPSHTPHLARALWRNIACTNQ